MPPARLSRQRPDNPNESIFAAGRHRIFHAMGSLSQKAERLMVHKLVQAAAKGWFRLKGANRLPMGVESVKFAYGVVEIDATSRAV